jgi:hypothetical protein
VAMSPESTPVTGNGPHRWAGCRESGRADCSPASQRRVRHGAVLSALAVTRRRFLVEMSTPRSGDAAPTYLQSSRGDHAASPRWDAAEWLSLGRWSDPGHESSGGRLGLCIQEHGRDDPWATRDMLLGTGGLRVRESPLKDGCRGRMRGRPLPG